MKFKVQLDGGEHEVEASADGTVTIGGEVLTTKVGRPAEDRRTVQVGEKTYEIRVIDNCVDTGILVLEIAGERIPVTVSDVVREATARVPGSPAAGPAVAGGSGGAQAAVPAEVTEGVWAPVPGKIVSVLVAVGDVVEEGAPVVVLEAMKMENELHAPKRGTVTAVLVNKGDQAEKGQLLVAFA